MHYNFFFFISFIFSASNSGFPRNTVLNEVGVRILPIEICNSAYGNVDENLMICAGRVDGAVDSCLVKILAL